MDLNSLFVVSVASLSGAMVIFTNRKTHIVPLLSFLRLNYDAFRADITTDSKQPLPNPRHSPRELDSFIAVVELDARLSVALLILLLLLPVIFAMKGAHLAPQFQPVMDTVYSIDVLIVIVFSLISTLLYFIEKRTRFIRYTDGSSSTE